MTRFALGVGALVLASAASTAQLPIGRSTPVGGFAPSLFSEPLWLGNPVYGYRIEGAPPGGQAVLVVSLQRSDQMLAGLQVYPDLSPQNVFVLESGTIDATGSATFLRPLSGVPEVPALAGIDFWAQAAVTDPASPSALGSTAALLLEVVLHPMLAFKSGTSPLVLCDVTTGGTSNVSGLPGPGAFTNGAVFGNGGHDLFFATSAGMFVIDSTAAAPQAVLVQAGNWRAPAWDRVRNRLYAFNDDKLVALEGDRISPGFGAILAQVSLAGITSFYPTSLSLSADGRIAAVGFPNGILMRFDTDPSSAAYLGAIPTAPSPIVWGFGTFVGKAELGADGRVVTIVVSNAVGQATTSIFRYDGNTNLWIDFDPVTPGLQPLSSLLDPSLPLSFGYYPERHGGAAWLPGLQSVVKISLPFAAPGSHTTSPAPLPPVSGARSYAAVSPSGRFLLERVSGIGTNVPIQVNLVDVTNGGVVPLATVIGSSPGTGDTQIAVWR